MLLQDGIFGAKFAGGKGGTLEGRNTKRADWQHRTDAKAKGENRNEWHGVLQVEHRQTMGDSKSV